LPIALATGDGYVVRGVSVSSPTLTGATPPMTILHRNAVGADGWTVYP
jgi:hypothetical protein